MRVLPFVTLATAANAAAQQPPSTTGLTKIIEMLTNMHKQSVGEQKAKMEDARLTKLSCVEVNTQQNANIANEQTRLEEATACAEAENGNAANKNNEVVQLNQEINQLEERKAAAKATWDKQSKEATANIAELADGVNMLSRAYNVLKRALAPKDDAAEGAESLIQMTRSGAITEKQADEVQKTLIGLAAIVDANASFASSGKAKVSSFLEKLAGDDSMSFSFAQQPQASTSSYDSKSGSILETILDMQKNAEEELTGVKNQKIQNRHAWEMIEQQTTSAIENNNEQVSKLQEQAAAAQAKAGECESNAEQSQANLDNFKGLLAQNEHDCTSYEEEHKRIISDMTEEQTVLTTAVDILKGNFPAPEEAAPPAGFLQLRKVAKHNHFSFLSDANDASAMEVKTRFATALRELGQQYSSFNLIQAANMATSSKAGVFDKIIDMVNTMIDKLQKEQTDEAAKHADCEAKKKEGNAKVKAAQSELDKHMARKDVNTAKIAKNKKLVTETTSNLAATRAEVDAKTAVRNEEAEAAHNNVVLAESDIEALTKALTVLGDYYSQDASGRGKSEKADAIMKILRTAVLDTQTFKTDTETNEEAAKKSHQAFVQQAKITQASMEATIKAKNSHVKNLEQADTTIDSDLASATETHNAASKYLDNVRSACTVEVMTFEQKQAKRQAEIDGLKVALEILAEESAA